MCKSCCCTKSEEKKKDPGDCTKDEVEECHSGSECHQCAEVKEDDPKKDSE